jgi:DNA-binding MarR family transcriptional regulator
MVNTMTEDDLIDTRVPSGEPHFDSPLLGSLWSLVNRLNSHRFQFLHATRLENGRDFTANKVLFILGSLGPVRPSVLADEVATGRANVSKVVKRLEEEGLVVRRPDPDDSRASLIALTGIGAVASREEFRIGDEMLHELTASWKPGEVETFTRLLGSLSGAAADYEARLAEASTIRSAGTAEIVDRTSD